MATMWPVDINKSQLDDGDSDKPDDHPHESSDSEVGFNPLKPRLCDVEGSPRDISDDFLKACADRVFPLLISTRGDDNEENLKAIDEIETAVDKIGLNIPAETIAGLQEFVGCLKVIRCLLDPTDEEHIGEMNHIKKADKEKQLTALQESLLRCVAENPRLKESYKEFGAKAATLSKQSTVNSFLAKVRSECSDAELTEILKQYPMLEMSTRSGGTKKLRAALLGVLETVEASALELCTDGSGLANDKTVEIVNAKVTALLQAANTFVHMATKYKITASTCQKACEKAKAHFVAVEVERVLKMLEGFENQKDAEIVQQCLDICDSFRASSAASMMLTSGVATLNDKLKLVVAQLVRYHGQEEHDASMRKQLETLSTKLVGILSTKVAAETTRAKEILAKTDGLIATHAAWSSMGQSLDLRWEMDIECEKTMTFFAALLELGHLVNNPGDNATATPGDTYNFEPMILLHKKFEGEAEEYKKVVNEKLRNDVQSFLEVRDLKSVAGGGDNGETWSKDLRHDAPFPDIVKAAKKTIMNKNFKADTFSAMVDKFENLLDQSQKTRESLGISMDPTFDKEMQELASRGRATIEEGLVLHWLTSDMGAVEKKKNWISRSAASRRIRPSTSFSVKTCGNNWSVRHLSSGRGRQSESPL